MTTPEAKQTSTEPASSHHTGHREIEVPDESHMTPMDYGEHDRTYSGFLNLTKWGIVAVVIVLILMAFFLL